MKKLRIGVLDLVYDSAPSAGGYKIYRTQLRRQFATIMPQVVSVWCRQLGHETFYAVYYGQDDPTALLPPDLDFLFVSAYTQASLLAYGVAKMYRGAGTTTVIGGPHAKGFPADCQRFFDYVVLDCDRSVIADILGDQYERPGIIDTGRSLTEMPTVRERMPELLASTLGGRRAVFRVVPILSSVGCPYTCSFCSDAVSTYHALTTQRLQQDLAFVSDHIQNAYVVFHDANFGVRFTETLEAIESLPAHARPPYGIQSTLSILKESRVKRLNDTGCIYVAPGVESWADFSAKSGGRALVGRDKLERVIEHFESMHRYIPGFQANFVFGTDADEGAEPVTLTNEFIRRVPYAWPGVGIPTPFGNTEMFSDYQSQGRILTSMPLGLYYKPYLNFVPLHYSPVDYYRHLISIMSTIVSLKGVVSRIQTSTPWIVKAIHLMQMTGVYHDLRRVRDIYRLMSSDPNMRAYHEGGHDRLPAYYREKMNARLGRYQELFTESELVPDLGRSVRTTFERPLELMRPAAGAP